MSSKKRRRAFNSEWRKARKVLKRARAGGVPRHEPTVNQLASKYNIDYPNERIR